MGLLTRHPATSHGHRPATAQGVPRSRHALLLVASTLLAAGALAAARNAVLMRATISGASMSPVLGPGDRVLAVRRPFARVRRGAVVLGRTPDGADAGPLRVTDPASGKTTVLEPATAPYFVKRVVGLPGDRIRPRHDAPGAARRTDPVAEVEVPAGTCFVEGEAGHSVDSCAWGPVPLGHVMGVVVLRSRRPGPAPVPAVDLPPVPSWLAR